MIRAAIVGLGWWGKTLTNAVQDKSEAIRFVAGQTRSPEKAQDFCREKGIDLLGSIDEVLARHDVDAVVLATPHSQHAEQIGRVAAAGKHCFVEKPITLTLKSAEEAVAAADRARIVLAVGYNRRFHPSMGEVRARVRDGRLGEPIACMGEVTAKTAPFMPKDLWRTDPNESPAGAMAGMGVHLVDAMIDLFGRMREVTCITTRRAATVMDDTTHILIAFENGMTGTIFGSLSTATNFRFAAYGSNGMAEVLKPSLDTFRFVPAPDRPPTGAHPTMPPEVVETPGFDTLKAELEAFAAAIQGGPAFPVTRDEILHGVAVFEAVVRSSASGRPERV